MKLSIRPAYPAVLVIFGVTGDLAQRKLLPALLHLYQRKALPRQFSVIGFSRRDWDDERFRKEVRAALMKNMHNARGVDEFLKMFHFQPGLFHEKSSYKNLVKHIQRIDDRWKICTNTLFHLAVSPEYYPLILKNLARHSLTIKCGPKEGWSRILVEKPFGNDSETAQKLDSLLGAIFRERQIFRVDHYLGKETIQNILTFRFSNSLFEPIWNNIYIRQIDIKLLEKGDISGRGEYYDAVGALRDVGQNHILQMLSLIAMDNPQELNGERIRRNRAGVIKSLKIFTKKELRKSVVRGQYVGYAREDEVKRNSKTETYFKIKAYLKTKRWRGVPFYLESGKCLNKAKTEIVVHFKSVEPCFCPPGHEKHHHENSLAFQIQPTEGIKIRFWSKKPGLMNEVEPRELSFFYQKNSRFHLSGYEKLLYDAIVGDQTLFSSTEEVMAAWRFITPIVKNWTNLPLYKYARGARSPKI